MNVFCQALLLWLASATIATAGWKVITSERENPPNDLVEHRQTEVENEETGDRATLHFALFDTESASLRVVDQAQAPRRDLAEVMTQAGALAAVNGGYFDPADAPIGLLVSAGRMIAPLSKARLLSGVLSATATRVEVVRATRFKMSGKIQNAVQCGPLLVERSTPVAGLNAARLARRTFAAVDGKHRAAVGFCSAVSLAELGKILALAKVAGELKVVRAINLDGGSSSAFWVADRRGDFSIPEQKTVRDFVAIVARAVR